MKVINTLPPHYIEHEYFKEMIAAFDPKVFKDLIVYITSSRSKIDVTGKNVVVIQTAGNEKAEVPEYRNKVKVVFKHHLDRDHQGNVYHIPLPYVGGFTGTDTKPINERKYDVLFIGRKLNNRADAIKAMDELVRVAEAPPLPPRRGRKPAYEHRPLNILIKYTDKFMGGLPLEEYSKVISDSKIVISPRGAVRCECLRFSEAVRCGCAIVAAAHPPLRVFNACPAVYTDDWSRLQQIIEDFTPDRLDDIHQAMKACYAKYFSPKGVAAYINTIVGRHQ